MTILITGASGATGLQLVEQLLDRGHTVKAIVRTPAKFPELLKNRDNMILIQGAILDLSTADLTRHVKDCDGVASCLGHNLTMKGIFGAPRRLVTEAVGKLCNAITSNMPEKPVRFVLMNTTGNRNKDLKEKRTPGESLVISLIRLLVPPQSDNEKVAEYLRGKIGRENKYIQWSAVRPDGLIDEEKVSPYSIHPSPVRSPIFNAGKTSRINVGHIMAQLLTDDDTWKQWRGQMPVIYNNHNL